MSQFSYGALARYRARGERLPVAGGFDRDGRLTDDPAAIEASRRPLPIGFWKGSGLSSVLDVIAAALAGGRATHEIGIDPEQETGLSQVFIAIDPASLEGVAVDRIAEEVVASVQARYPGERALAARREHLQNGIDVDEEAWTLARRYASA
jgi:3-dehydro-L-gulonate 2-dehydrogenase